METNQRKMIKQRLGLSKYSRNTNLFQAQNINKVLVSHNIYRLLNEYSVLGPSSLVGM